ALPRSTPRQCSLRTRAPWCSYPLHLLELQTRSVVGHAGDLRHPADPVAVHVPGLRGIDDGVDDALRDRVGDDEREVRLGQAAPLEHRASVLALCAPRA